MPTVTQLNVEIGAKLDKLDKGLAQANRKLDRFGNDVGKVDRKLGGFNRTIGSVGRSLLSVFAGAEIIRGIGNIIADSSKLAAEAEGVSEAFNRLNTPGLLANLRQSTTGTVSDLELMRKAVQANNFQIPVQNLGSLFEFAAKRAQQTGESVDFLVNSIVLGIGRKSPLILDNLGISAVRLRKELKGTGTELSTVGDIAAAVGRIAQEEMGKAGDIIETTKIKTEQLSASWDNFKTALGESVNNLGAVQQGLSNWSKFLQFVTDDLNGVNKPARALETVLKDINQVQGEIKFLETLEQLPGRVERLNKKLAELRKELVGLTAPDFDLGKSVAGDSVQPAIGAIADINKQIKETQDQIVNASRAELPILNAKLENLKQQKSLLQFIGTEASQRTGDVGLLGLRELAPRTLNTSGGRFTESFINTDILNRTQELNRIINELGQNTALAEAKNIAFGNSYDLVGEKLSLTEQAITQLIEAGINPQNEAVVSLQSEYQRLIQVYDEQNEKLQESTRLSEEFSGVLATGLNTIFNLLVRNNDELSKFGKLIGSTAFGVLSAVLTGGNPLIGGIRGLFQGLGSFASGGIAVGPQLAVVGDNPGRKEAIIPSELFGQIGGGGGTQEFRIKGQDLVLLLDRQARLDNRTR